MRIMRRWQLCACGAMTALLSLAPGVSSGQWLNQMDPRIPRTPDGKPNLSDLDAHVPKVVPMEALHDVEALRCGERETVSDDSLGSILLVPLVGSVSLLARQISIASSFRRVNDGRTLPHGEKSSAHYVGD